MGVAVTGEGRVVGVPKFHSWGKCTMPSNASSGLCINLCMISVSSGLVGASLRMLVFRTGYCCCQHILL